jgi:hypothetical protein
LLAAGVLPASGHHVGLQLLGSPYCKKTSVDRPVCLQ